MRYILFMLFVLFSITAQGQFITTSVAGGPDTQNPDEVDYYVSAGGGGDTLTISEVNALSPIPGDIIAFNKGDVFRGEVIIPTSGTAAEYIEFTSYGTGDKPKILGSNTTTWVNVAGNVWAATDSMDDPLTLATDDIEIWFVETDGSISWGDTVANEAALAAEYDWCMKDNSDSTIYVYAATDPDARYTSVEIPQRETGFNFSNDPEYIEIDGFEIAYTLSGTGEQSYPTGDFTGYILRNCKIHHLGTRDGGGYGSNVAMNNMLIEGNEIYESGRRNVSLYNYGNDTLENITIQDNTLHDGYHTTGIDISTGGGPGGSQAGGLDSVVIRRNIMYDGENDAIYGGNTTTHTLVSSDEGTGDVDRFYYYNNIVKYIQGAGIQIEGALETHIFNNTFYGTNKSLSGGEDAIFVYYSENAGVHELKNNIYYHDAVNADMGAPICVYVAGSHDPGDIDSDYNLYWTTDATAEVMREDSPLRTITMAEFADSLQTGLGWDLNSPTPANPLVFSDVYDIQTGSDGIDNALDLSEYFTVDLNESTRSGWYIGAVESSARGDTITTYAVTSTKKDTVTIAASGYPTSFERVHIRDKESSAPADTTDGTQAITTNDSTAVAGDYVVSTTDDANHYTYTWVKAAGLWSLDQNQAIISVDSAGPTYTAVNAEYQAVFNDYTDKPVDSIASFGDTVLVSRLKTLLGSWNDVELMGVYAIHTNDNNEAFEDWSSNGTNGAGVASPAFAALNGITSDDASNAYINYAGFTFSGFAVDSVTVLWYGMHDVGAGLEGICGSQNSGASRFFEIYSNGGTDIVGRHFSGSTGSVTEGDLDGAFGYSADATNSGEYWRNGVSIGTFDPAANGLPDQEFHVGDTPNAGQGDYEFAMFIVINRIFTNAMMVTAHDIMNDYMTHLGTNVY